MDFVFSAEDEAFRTEVRAFYRKELPADFVGGLFSGEEDHHRTVAIRKKMASKGWLTMSWPKQYGGQDAPITRQLIFAEESSYIGFSARDAGVGFLGPAIMAAGTEEQKQRFLGPISRAEISFHQGFSEPDAGSDLAGLKTRADRDGDFYVIKGQKVWGGSFDRAEYSFLLARTDQNAPKHKGISLLIIPTSTPGVRAEEFGNLGGGSQNLVYYDGARVPVRECLIGEENRGWYVATTALNLERAVVEYAAYGKRFLEDMVVWWRAQGRDKQTDPVNRVLRAKLAQVAIEIEVCRMLSYRIGWLVGKGGNPSTESSEMKIFGSEMVQRMSHLGTNIASLASQFNWEAPPARYRMPLGGNIDKLLRQSVSFSIIGGANEIQRGVIASRGLGLPRD